MEGTAVPDLLDGCIAPLQTGSLTAIAHLSRIMIIPPFRQEQDHLIFYPPWLEDFIDVSPLGQILEEAADGKKGVHNERCQNGIQGRRKSHPRASETASCLGQQKGENFKGYFF